ncbi:hypothetical protein GW17_00026431 [Ensete ventricosum]|nr:hypothetical protein GW17_00026431 [Ensete ventricosum]RZS07204.1 hypothetical protein BHM03_00037997 [Ensete ventricosum]
MPLAGAAASMRCRPREIKSPNGVSNACGQAARGGCPLHGRKGQPHGQGCRMQGRPLLQGQHQRKAAPPAREVPPEGISACHRGGCPRRRRAALPPAQCSDDDILLKKG